MFTADVIFSSKYLITFFLAFLPNFPAKDWFFKINSIAKYNEAGSAVLLKMGLVRGEGLLCIGSNEPAMFSQEIDTMFVRYMADVLSSVINSLIEL